MNEYEVIDVLSSLRDEIGVHVTNFVAVLFGYLATAYFVGPKLSTFQVSAINFLYFVYTPGPLFAIYESSVAMRNVYENYSEVAPYPVAATELYTFIPSLAPGMVIASWLVSLAFMFQIRRQRSADPQ